MIIGIPRKTKKDEYRVALCNATLPYLRQLAALGVEAFAAAFPDLPAGP